MGACLSKTGKKGREAGDQDKAPYVRADGARKDKKKDKKKDKRAPATGGAAVGDDDDHAAEAPSGDREAEVTSASAGEERDKPEGADDEDADKAPEVAVAKTDVSDGPDAESASPKGMTGTEAVVVKETVENDERTSQTTVVKETDVKVEMTSEEDGGAVHVTHQKQTLSKTLYDNQGEPPMASVSVSREVHPVSMTTAAAVDDGKMAAGGESREEPMALFGALKYLKEQEAKAAGGGGGETEVNETLTSNRPVSDLFSNMYKPSPVRPGGPGQPSITTTTLEQQQQQQQQPASGPTRPISDVFTNMYKDTTPAAGGATSSVMTSEIINKGSVQVQRVQHVITTSSTSSSASPVRSPEKKEESSIQNGLSTPTKPLVNGVQVETRLDTPPGVTNGNDSEEGSSPPSSPLTPLRITEPGDKTPPSASHVTANVIINSPDLATSAVTPPKVTVPEVSVARPSPFKDDGTDEKDEDKDKDEEEDPAEQEPVIRKRLRCKVKELFVDFRPANDVIMNRHHLCSITRQQLMATIAKWVGSESAQQDGAEGETSAAAIEHHMILVAGPPGIGKTCVAAEAVKRHGGEHVIGCHFFEQGNTGLSHNRLASVVTSLAHAFCGAFPNYVNILPPVEKLRAAVVRGSVPELVELLLKRPLAAPELERDPDVPGLIVLDAIDECDAEDQDALLNMLETLAESGPPWLRVLLTSRSDNKQLLLMEREALVKKLEMKPNSNKNTVDLKRYFREPLGRFMDRISLDGGLTQLAKKTQGSFLCASVLRKRLDALPPDRKIALREIVPMFPSSLSGVCKEMFDNFLESLGDVVHDGNAKRAYAAILSNMAVAREPLPVSFLDDVLPVGAGRQPLSVLAEISDVLLVENERVGFCHREIAEWLLDDLRAATCAVDLVQGREQLSNLCLRWLEPILSEEGAWTPESLETVNPLMEYALKHAVHHLLDVPKQQENLSRLLCSLRYIQSKLSVRGIHVGHVIEDYQHHHLQPGKSGAVKAVSLAEYMKRQPRMLEQMQCYRKFLEDKREDIGSCPSHVLQVAANYSAVERIRQNAWLELEQQAWLEDATALPETHAVVVRLPGAVRALDVSPDGRTIAAVCKDDEYNVRLHLINSLTGEQKFPPLDIKSLNDRVGLLARFFPDGGHVFVGSLTTLVSTRGKTAPSGFDVGGIELKDKFSIECADVSMKHFACGLTTFPWGGKSLHLAIFDMRTKKCLKTIEVLRFRYGGSAQFSIRACAVARDKSYVCACVKQSPKPQLRIIVWNVSKFQVVNSIDVANEEMAKCLFVGDQTVLLGAGIRSKASHNGFPKVPTEFWNYKEVTNKVSERWDAAETRSLLSSHEDVTACCRWYSSSESAVVHVWQAATDAIVGLSANPSTPTSPSFTSKNAPSSASYRIRGVGNASELLSGGNLLVFLINNDICVYNIDDLDPLPGSPAHGALPSGGGGSDAGLASLPELLVHSMAFLPRSESLVITSKDHSLPPAASPAGQDEEEVPTYSVYISELTAEEEMGLISTPFIGLPHVTLPTVDGQGQFKTFWGVGASGALCFPAAEGHVLVFNAGDHLQIWERASNSVTTLPTYEQLKETKPEFEEFGAVHAAASPKDAILAVVYGQLPCSVYLYDARHGTQLRVLERLACRKSAITDLMFMPSNGLLLTYHRSLDHQLITWNPRTGDQVTCAHEVISYARASGASDRLVLSGRSTRRNEGQVILRSSDGKINRKLTTSNAWLPSNADSDLMFSPDGTALVGVCYATSVCRIWNAGNGDVLNDLEALLRGDADVVGMITNTHAILQDDRLTVIDIASGLIDAILPLNDGMDRKWNRSGMLISPKGGVVVGLNSSSNLKVFRCHNFSSVKRKTTLQRMISFQKETSP